MGAMLRVLSIAGLCAFVACARTEESAVDLVKQAVSEAKQKPRVEMRVARSADEPTAADQALLRSLETAVEQQNVGRLVSSGFEAGTMTVTIEVENTADAIDKLQDIARGTGLAGATTYRVIAP